MRKLLILQLMLNLFARENRLELRDHTPYVCVEFSSLQRCGTLGADRPYSTRLTKTRTLIPPLFLPVSGNSFRRTDSDT